MPLRSNYQLGSEFCSEAEEMQQCLAARVQLAKLTVSQLTKNVLPFLETENP
jgi:hypothetical protein